jgi:hypothetical protein
VTRRFASGLTARSSRPSPSWPERSSAPSQKELKTRSEKKQAPTLGHELLRETKYDEELWARQRRDDRPVGTSVRQDGTRGDGEGGQAARRARGGGVSPNQHPDGESSRMKIAHAGALALVVWYLMTPPYEHASNRIYMQAPLFDWHISASFGSSVECEKFLESQIQFYRNYPKAEYDRWLKGLTSAERCVLSDDPRLKSK